MLRKQLLSLALLLTGAGAVAQSNTVVEGHITGLKAGTKVYLSRLTSSVKADSAIAENGRFRLNVQVEEGDSYLLRAGNDRMAEGSSALL